MTNPSGAESAPSKTKVLLVEDDVELARSVREYLEAYEYAVVIETRGDRAPERILRESPDIVILDLMLPGLDGLSICREVRSSYTGPILMLTALGDDADQIVGLEVGADDYLAKPVRPRLLLARLRALLRPTRRPAPAEAARAGAVLAGTIEADFGTRTARARGRVLDLTDAEFDLLVYLLENPGRVVTRDELYQALRGVAYDGLDRSIDLRVSRLRVKLGDDPKHPRWIKSVRGVGYILAGSQ